MASRAVTAAGHDVIEAANGQDALDAIKIRTPDMVITDLLMPVLGGFELIELIRQHHASLPVIVVSADIQLSSRTRGQELGCVAFLRKPVNPTELSQLIESIFSQRGVA
jgi:twitching motility two-component system response regulator PilH